MSAAVDPDTICLVSGGDLVRSRSYVNHRIWAAEAGIDYRLEIGIAPGRRTPYDPKFTAIRNVLPRYSWIIWVDDDVYFTDWRPGRLLHLVDDAERSGLWGVLAQGPTEPGGHWSVINTGVMILRNDPRTFSVLDRAQYLDLAEARERWDEGRDGLFTHGDQDTIWTTVREDPDLFYGLRIVGHADLNSRPHLVGASPAEVLTVHFCGPGDKRARVARFAARFGMGQELVPATLLDAYAVQHRELLPAAEVAAREAADRAGALTRRVQAKVAWVRSTRRWR